MEGEVRNEEKRKKDEIAIVKNLKMPVQFMYSHHACIVLDVGDREKPLCRGYRHTCGCNER